MAGISIVLLIKKVHSLIALVVIVYITISVLYSCNPDKKQSDKNTVQPFKTITLPYKANKDLLQQHQSIYYQDNNAYLYKMNPKNTVIYIYHIGNNCTIEDSVLIPGFLQNNNPRFSVISKDSILFYDKYGFWGVYLFNKKTNTTDTLPFPPHPDFSEEKKVSHYLNVTYQNMPYFKYPYLYLKVSVWTSERKNQNGHILQYDIRKKKGTYFVDFPKQFPYIDNQKMHPHYAYNGIENHFNFVLYENKVIGFYPVFDTLYVYDVFTHKLTEKKKVTSEYIKLPPRKFQKNEIPYFYTSEIPFYRQILYDPYRNVFYITVKHYLNMEKTVNQGDENFSVLVLNTHLKVIKEWFFEAKKYDYNNILILPDGVYISNTNNYADKNAQQSFSGFNLLAGVSIHNK